LIEKDQMSIVFGSKQPSEPATIFAKIEVPLRSGLKPFGSLSVSDCAWQIVFRKRYNWR